MAPAKSSCNNRGFTLVEVVIAMGLLTMVSLGVAQLFAASTRANLSARTGTSTTAMAEQKMEQIRSLTWGFDTAGQGLPVSDTTTNLAVYPFTSSGTGLNPSPADSLEQNITGCFDYVDSAGVWVGNRDDAARHRGLSPALGDHAAADESQQHAGDSGAGHADGERAGTDVISVHAYPDERRFAAHQRENKEGLMSTTARLRSEAGYSLIELLVSSAIMITVTGAIFGLVNPSQGTSQTQPEVADLQQRVRVGIGRAVQGDGDGRRWHLSGAGPLAARQLLRADPAAARPGTPRPTRTTCSGPTPSRCPTSRTRIRRRRSATRCHRIPPS